MPNELDAFAAQAAVQDTLLQKAHVVGVAVGYKDDKTADDGEPSVVVLVEQKLPLAALSASDLVPKSIDGVRTDVYEVGYLRAYNAANPRDRYRPTVPSGVSVGHYKVTSGTLGAIVTDRSSGRKLILSNNHVLANSNDALAGDVILQPGAADAGHNPGDVVAQLERFVPLTYIGEQLGPLPPTPDPGPDGGGCLLVVVNIINAIVDALGTGQRLTTVPQAAGPAAQQAPTPQAMTTQTNSNTVDAAVARPVNADMFTGEIQGIGRISGIKEASLGQTVRKSGRTTGLTTGTVTLLNATVNIAYGARSARFTGQVITTGMSQGGDSGSLVVDGAENKAVGLLFAGSGQATIFTPIRAVLDALNVDLL